MFRLKISLYLWPIVIFGILLIPYFAHRKNLCNSS